MKTFTRMRIPERHQRLAQLVEEISVLRDLVRTGPIDDVVENHSRLVDALIRARGLAHRLARLHDELSIKCSLVDSQMTEEALRLTQVGVKSAPQGAERGSLAE